MRAWLGVLKEYYARLLPVLPRFAGVSTAKRVNKQASQRNSTRSELLRRVEEVVKAASQLGAALHAEPPMSHDTRRLAVVRNEPYLGESKLNRVAWLDEAAVAEFDAVAAEAFAFYNVCLRDTLLNGGDDQLRKGDVNLLLPLLPCMPQTVQAEHKPELMAFFSSVLAQALVKQASGTRHAVRDANHEVVRWITSLGDSHLALALAAEGVDPTGELGQKQEWGLSDHSREQLLKSHIDPTERTRWTTLVKACDDSSPAKRAENIATLIGMVASNLRVGAPCALALNRLLTFLAKKVRNESADMQTACMMTLLRAEPDNGHWMRNNLHASTPESVYRDQPELWLGIVDDMLAGDAHPDRGRCLELFREVANKWIEQVLTHGVKPWSDPTARPCLSSLPIPQFLLQRARLARATRAFYNFASCVQRCTRRASNTPCLAVGQRRRGPPWGRAQGLARARARDSVAP